MTLVRTTILWLGLMAFSSATAELVVYDVDAKYRQEIFSALRSVLQREQPGEVSGSVAMLPTGQLLIDATPERHAQVAAVLEAIDAYEAEPAPQVTLRYWAVLGSRGPTTATTTPEILSDTIDELRRINGNLAFRVIGNATLVTESGQTGSVGGDPFGVEQKTYVEGDKLNAELDMHFSYPVQTAGFQTPAGGPQPFQTIRRESQSVELVTSMRPNEFVVVGQSTVAQMAVGDDELSGTIFFIVNWPVAD